jgi:hypothetical protein
MKQPFIINLAKRLAALGVVMDGEMLAAVLNAADYRAADGGEYSGSGPALYGLLSTCYDAAMATGDMEGANAVACAFVDRVDRFDAS